MPVVHAHSFGRPLIRAAALALVGVLLFVPALTRAVQRDSISTSSHAPTARFSFSKSGGNCPPKKIVMTPVLAIIPLILGGTETVRLPQWTRPPAARLLPSPVLSAPRSLRAPPSAPLA